MSFFKIYTTVLFFSLTANALIAQNAKMPMLPGEFFLENVAEVASGFRFNADSTFDFFFSYGAVDREGHGRWHWQGNAVALNSPVKTRPDFILKEARSQGPQHQLIVQVTDPNENILGYVYGQVRLADGSTVNAESDARGRIVFQTAAKPVEFRLIHGLWPNEPSPVRIEDPAINYYEFTINPQIVEVEFKNLVLRADGEHLVGAHPLMEEQEFTYVRR